MTARQAVVLIGLLVLAARPAPAAAQELLALHVVQTTSAIAPVEGRSPQNTAFVDACPVAGFWINAGWWIDGIQVVCGGGGAPPWRGGTGGTRHGFSLAPGERIVAISGLAGGNSGTHLYALQIHTDQRSTPVYGNQGAAQGDPGRMPFRLDVPHGYTLVGIQGRTSQYLLSIGLVVAGPEAGGR
ncbi:MAG: jacalin-like lectin [Longimicrobiaceae bacterium]